MSLEYQEANIFESKTWTQSNSIRLEIKLMNWHNTLLPHKLIG